ncbi:MAG: hypothetical protein ACO1QB_12130 [Verrucomicrobiales bacterium]
MISQQLIETLCCPETYQPLAAANAGLIADLNQKIKAGKVVTTSGKPVTAPLDGGLLRADGRVLYPIRDHLPEMLIDKQIPLPQA